MRVLPRCPEKKQIEILGGTEILWEHAGRMTRVLLLCRVRMSKLYKEGLLERRAAWMR